MYSEVDAEFFVHNRMESILDCKKDSSAADNEDIYVGRSFKTDDGQMHVYATGGTHVHATIIH